MKGKLANGVGSQYTSHYLGTWCIQHYYRWCAQLGCQQSTELTPPGRFKWTRPFRRKTKSGSCACAITFQLASTSLSLVILTLTMRVFNWSKKTGLRHNAATRLLPVFEPWASVWRCQKSTVPVCSYKLMLEQLNCFLLQQAKYSHLLYLHLNWDTLT